MSSGAFRRVLAAEVVSTFGSLMSRLAIPWLAVLVLDAGPTAMAWLAVADVAAGALSALLLGALVDRWPKRRMMIAADLLRAAMLVTVPLMATVDRLTIGWLVVVVAVNGALTVAFELAQSAWIARSTVQEHLTQRNSALAAGGAITEAASFGITGWLFQWLGAIVVMATDALTYLVSALLLLKISEPPALVDEALAPTSLRGRVQLTVRKDMKLQWPRAETATDYISMATDEDLRTATTVAIQEMIDFLASTKGLSKHEAYQLVSIAGHVAITQLVDKPVHGVHVKMAKSVFR
jgi:MFS family permease